MTYDSRPETLQHRAEVAKLLHAMADDLIKRANDHDQSKLESPELETFNEFTPKLKGSTYGSEEYKQFLKEMGTALDHHYFANRHHPEHFDNGIRGMTLSDLLEMFCDWLAATKRHADGDIMRSIKMNQERFGYSDDIMAILENTAREAK